MKSKEIREKFLKFFEERGHQRVPSSSLIPAEDPTLLFTNAGMVQFKDCFLGVTDPGYRRATTSQKCVRAGGKHNDLENVGFTPRHHTFFEMLGNFSFGDYFKKEAIAFAWEFLTQELKLPEEKLRITVFETDDEAFELWKEQGIRPDWIYRLGEKDNFWAMGDTGPCGPCTEIHYDWGPDFGELQADGTPDFENGRFLEIWNLVFMQYNRDSQGNMTPLPKPSVDTGAGLERLAAVVQGAFSNYDTDLFQPTISAIATSVGKTYQQGDSEDSISMRVISDHLRSGTFLLADGVTASNEGRGYVLRRILRRAIRHGKKLGQEKPFMFSLVPTLVKQMGEFYPELSERESAIKEMMKEEEERFHETLHRGMGILEEALSQLKAGDALPGNIAFKLYDTFGFPLDLTQVICQEHKISIDEAGFQKCMEEQRAKSEWSGGADSGTMEALSKALLSNPEETKFKGYNTLASHENLQHLFDRSGQEVSSLDDEGYCVFASTPFYAEGGGQVGDTGALLCESGEAEVQNTFKIGKTFVHHVKLKKGTLKKGQSCELLVNGELRQRTKINHTSTHMLHAALRKVLGDRVRQAGSLVDPNRLRFDFTYPRGMTRDEIKKVESIVNEEIKAAHPVGTRVMNFDDAKKVGAIAFFDEKYGSTVRVISVGNLEGPFSVELCGGTHIENSAEVGLLKVTNETSVASGVRRIEAITSRKAVAFLESRNLLVEELTDTLKVPPQDLGKKIAQLLRDQKELSRQNEALKIKLAQGAGSGSGSGNVLWENKKSYGDIQVVMDRVTEGNAKILRTLVDQVRDKLPKKTMVLLASGSEDKATLCLGLTKDIADKYNAKELIQPLAKEVGGTGGGRPDFAQAGGSKPENINKVFELFHQWLEKNT